MGALVAMLAAHSALGWTRQAGRTPTLKGSLVFVLMAGISLGSGVCASMVLGLSSEPLPFPLGYRALLAPSIWAAAVVAELPAILLMVMVRGGWASLLAGTWTAALATGVQVEWIIAAGLRPGVTWQPDVVAISMLVMTPGFIGAMWMGTARTPGRGRHALLWHLGAATLMGLSLIAGQEVLISSVGLPTQIGSVYLREIPAPLLSLFAGVIIPFVLAVMALDLWMRDQARRRSRREGGRSMSPRKRRRQRSNVRQI
jgi:NO-binding membrane sensor protein with MHYT domain